MHCILYNYFSSSMFFNGKPFKSIQMYFPKVSKLDLSDSKVQGHYIHMNSQILCKPIQMVGFCLFINRAQSPLSITGAIQLAGFSTADFLSPFFKLWGLMCIYMQVVDFQFPFYMFIVLYVKGTIFTNVHSQCL